MTSKKIILCFALLGAILAIVEILTENQYSHNPLDPFWSFVIFYPTLVVLEILNNYFNIIYYYSNTIVLDLLYIFVGSIQFATFGFLVLKIRKLLKKS